MVFKEEWTNLLSTTDAFTFSTHIENIVQFSFVRNWKFSNSILDFSSYAELST